MAPRFQIKVHVLVFSVGLGVSCAIAYAYQYKYGKTEDELRELLLKKYPERQVQAQKDKKELQQFFDNLRDDSKKAEMDKVLRDVMRGGKGDMKRVDGQQAIKKSETVDTKEETKPEATPHATEPPNPPATIWNAYNVTSYFWSKR